MESPRVFPNSGTWVGLTLPSGFPPFFHFMQAWYCDNIAHRWKTVPSDFPEKKTEAYSATRWLPCNIERLYRSRNIPIMSSYVYDSQSTTSSQASIILCSRKYVFLAFTHTQGRYNGLLSYSVIRLWVTQRAEAQGRGYICTIIASLHGEE